jgi:DNA-binding MarR family transcriptional regulator
MVAEAVEEAQQSAELLAALELVVPRYIQVMRRTVEENGDPEPLTLPQYRCLQAIDARDVALTTQLARELGVTVPTMTSRIDGLVERNLVRRQPDPASRRQIQVSLTEDGTATLARYRALIDAQLNALLAPLSAVARARLSGAFGELATLLAPALPNVPDGTRAESG